MTAVIDHLERRGLVRRERNTGDRRFTSVVLTDSGEASMAAIFPAHARRIASALSTLSAAEQEELGRLCRKLGRAAAEEDTPDLRPASGGRRKENS